MTHAKQPAAIGLGSLLLCWACLLTGCNSEETTDDAETGGETAVEDGTDGSTGGGDGTGSGGAATGGGSAGPAGSSNVNSGGAGSDDGTGGMELTCPEQNDLASWLSTNTVDPCTKGCGPDKIGWKTCHKTDEPVCTVPPCAQCDLCEYTSPLPECYQTPGDPSLPPPPDCAEGVLKSDDCDAPCDPSSLCIHPRPTDETKLEGCICAERGEWACATYNLETNTWN